MNNTISRIIALCALTTCIAEAKGQNNARNEYSIGVFSGISIPQKFTDHPLGNYPKPKIRPTLGANLGIRVNEYLRTDFSIQNVDLTSTEEKANSSTKYKFKNLAGFANLSYDFAGINEFSPYVTAGIGINNIKGERKFNNHELKKLKARNQFAWNMGAGFRHNIAENIDLDLNYKYLDLGKAKFKNDTGILSVEENTFRTKLRANTVNLGISYNF